MEKILKTIFQILHDILRICYKNCVRLGYSLPLLSPTYLFPFQDKKKKKEKINNYVLYLHSIMDFE